MHDSERFRVHPGAFIIGLGSSIEGAGTVVIQRMLCACFIIFMPSRNYWVGEQFCMLQHHPGLPGSWFIWHRSAASVDITSSVTFQSSSLFSALASSKWAGIGGDMMMLLWEYLSYIIGCDSVATKKVKKTYGERDSAEWLLPAACYCRCWGARTLSVILVFFPSIILFSKFHQKVLHHFGWTPYVRGCASFTSKSESE